MAAPHVSGVAALIKSHYPDWDMEAMRQRIIRSIDRKSDLIALVASSGRLNAAHALEEDRHPPKVVEGFEVETVGLASFSVSWDQSGDDGARGQASHYEARIFPFILQTDSPWESGSLIPEEAMTTSASTRVAAQAVGLPINSKYYLYVRAMDNVGNLSPISNPHPIELPLAENIRQWDLSQQGSVALEADWARVDGPDGVYLSDSPNGMYRSDMDASAVLVAQVFPKPAALVFESRYDLEPNYDYGYVECSFDDGQRWEPLLVVTGNVPQWEPFYLELPTSASHPSPDSRVHLRFRTVTDHSVEKQGWEIRNITYYQQN